MINSFFKKAVSALVFSLVAMSPVMANEKASVCKAEDKAKVVNLSKQHGVFTLDFTNSSQACLEDFASGTSHKYLVYVAESGSKAWRNATVEAAKIDKREGFPVMVAFAKDRDGDPKSAETYVWANGTQIDVAPWNVKEGYTVDMIVNQLKEDARDEIHTTGHAVYQKYHGIPSLAVPLTGTGSTR